MLTLTLFGATGDLARRKLFPALEQLAQQDALPKDLQIQALGRRDYNTAQFLEQIPAVPTLAPMITYVKIDISQPEGYAQLVVEGEQVIYLAVEPSLLETVVKHLGQMPKPASRRIVLEKPFGSDLLSAQTLDRLLASIFSEEQIFRLDHYLGKETVQNILAFRFANPLIGEIWSKEHIDHIQVTVAESEGIGTRAAFYDQTGAIRDILQNHILQVLAFLLMEQPASLTFTALAKEVNLTISSLSVDSSNVITGQYDGYAGTGTVPPETQTETYVAAKFYSNLPKWQGIPIYVRTGKALSQRVSEIAIQLRQVNQNLFSSEEPTYITLRLQPDEGINLQLVTKQLNADKLQSVDMQFCYESLGERLPDAYERLFSDIMINNRTFALRSDVIESSWKLIDQLRAEHAQAPLRYPEGSWGPQAADTLIERDGRKWQTSTNNFCTTVLAN